MSQMVHSPDPDPDWYTFSKSAICYTNSLLNIIIIITIFRKPTRPFYTTYCSHHRATQGMPVGHYLVRQPMGVAACCNHCVHHFVEISLIALFFVLSMWAKLSGSGWFPTSPPIVRICYLWTASPPISWSMPRSLGSAPRSWATRSGRSSTPYPVLSLLTRSPHCAFCRAPSLFYPPLQAASPFLPPLSALPPTRPYFSLHSSRVLSSFLATGQTLR